MEDMSIPKTFPRLLYEGEWYAAYPKYKNYIRAGMTDETVDLEGYRLTPANSELERLLIAQHLQEYPNVDFKYDDIGLYYIITPKA